MTSKTPDNPGAIDDEAIASLRSMLECAKERFTNGWNAKSEKRQAREMSAGLDMLEAIDKWLMMETADD